MAVDHALLESVQHGAGPVLRLYAWAPACISFGRNQQTGGIYDPAALAAAGVDAVRRPTGGLAVLHDRELTYAVIAPVDRFGGPRTAYQRINAALVTGLRTLGVPVTLAGAAAAPHPVHDAAAPCFHAPAPGEIVAAGRKLVGSAQRCERGVLLQHGSILLDGSQEDMARYHDTAWRPRGHGATTLGELLGAVPDPAAVGDAVVRGFEGVLGIALARSTLSPDEAERAARLQRLYAAGHWTWRR